MNLMKVALYGLCLLIGAITIFSVLFMVAVYRTHSKGHRERKQKQKTYSMTVFLGSGGHSAEMIRMIRGLDFTRCDRRVYLVSVGDVLSGDKALELEKEIGHGEFEIVGIPRARHVHQSYVSSIFTTINSIICCFWIVSWNPSDVILLNGPGTCVAIGYVAFLPRLINNFNTKLIYVESLARTRNLSLSAQLLRPILDRFFVQWDELREILVRSETKSKMRAPVECEGWLL